MPAPNRLASRAPVAVVRPLGVLCTSMVIHVFVVHALGAYHPIPVKSVRKGNLPLAPRPCFSLGVPLRWISSSFFRHTHGSSAAVTQITAPLSIPLAFESLIALTCTPDCVHLCFLSAPRACVRIPVLRPVRACKRIRARIRPVPPGATMRRCSTLAPASAPAPHSCSPPLARPCAHSCPNLICATGRDHATLLTLVPTSAPAPHSCSPPLARSCAHSCPPSTSAPAFAPPLFRLGVCVLHLCSAHRCVFLAVALRLLYARIAPCDDYCPRLSPPHCSVFVCVLLLCGDLPAYVCSSTSRRLPQNPSLLSHVCCPSRFRRQPLPSLPSICCPNIDYAFPDVRKKTATLVLV